MALLLALAGVAHAQDGLIAVPTLTARVTDQTGTLTADQQAALESDLTALEQRKGAQLGVLIVPTTQPEDIAAYAIRVFDQWKLGRKNVDDGALLIVAKDDRRSRIEVGRGLEGAIPDAAAARILREYLTPKFRSGDFNGGIRDTTTALTALVDGEPLPEPWVESSNASNPNDWKATLFGGIFAALWAAAFFRSLPRTIRPLFVGGAAGIVSFIVGGSLVLTGMAVVIGLLFGCFGFPTGRYANSSGGGSYSGGGGSSWGGSSGGGGGGGFSGGGGSSAGGGASGSW